MRLEFAGEQYDVPDECHLRKRNWALAMLKNFGAGIFLESRRLRGLAPCVLDELLVAGVTSLSYPVESTSLIYPVDMEDGRGEE